MPHPNSLMYNVYIIPFYPLKAYWFVRKVSDRFARPHSSLSADPEDPHPPRLPQGSWRPSWSAEAKRILHRTRRALTQFLSRKFSFFDIRNKPILQRVWSASLRSSLTLNQRMKVPYASMIRKGIERKKAGIAKLVARLWGLFDSENSLLLPRYCWFRRKRWMISFKVNSPVS